MSRDLYRHRALIGLTDNQLELLRLMGKTFAPRTQEELGRLYYPNHSVWADMGPVGKKSWGALLGKVGGMLCRLKHEGMVLEVESKSWAVSRLVDKDGDRHYFEWLTVMADELLGGEELEERIRAERRICWFFLESSLGYRHGEMKVVELYDQTVLACLRALVRGARWSKKSGRTEVAQAIGKGIDVRKSPLDDEARQELREGIEEVLPLVGQGRTSQLLRSALAKLTPVAIDG